MYAAGSHSKIVFTTIPATRIQQDALYSYRFTVYDSLRRNISFTVAGLPAWLTYNPTDRSLSGKAMIAGQYQVHILAFADNDTVHQYFMLTVFDRQTVNILCIGNSITNGTDRYNSYRRSLWKLLHDHSYNFDLIGSWNKHHMGGSVPDPDFDMDHEGHSGWRTDHMFQPPDWDTARGNVFLWLKAYTPDIVLLELGTNDVFQCRTVPEMLTDMARLVSLFQQKNKRVKIFIAQIPPLGRQWAVKKLCGNDTSYSMAIITLNKAIVQFCTTQRAKGAAITPVDQFSGVNTDADMYDDIHPNENGEYSMAKKWFDAIHNFLPRLTQHAQTEPVHGRAYYFHHKGSDTNNGSLQKPWATIAKLNSLQLVPGDTVYLEGGQIFTGHAVITAAEGTKDHPVHIMSYGKGRSMIDGANGTALSMYKSSYLIVENIELRGSGRKTGNTKDGLIIKSCHHVMLSNIDIKGFQKSGLLVASSSYVDINKVYAVDNGFAGIHITGDNGQKNCFAIHVNQCRAANNAGDPTNLINHSGNGILAGFCKNVVIEHSTATNNGWDMPRKGNGPVGIWCYEADSVVIQHCISYKNRTSPGGGDGGGFDLDGGVTNSVIQYCRSYDNEGSGFGIFQYQGASAWHHNIIRHSVSENDGAISAAHAGVFIWNNSGDSSLFRDLLFYNNAVYNKTGAALHYDHESKHAGFRFYNNLFATNEELIVGSASGSSFSGNSFQPPAQTPTQFRPGKVWNDTQGNPINAHGGGLLYHHGMFYWYGEIKKGKTWRVPYVTSWEDYRVQAGGVSCYSSRDLLNWKYEGAVLAPDTLDPSHDLHTSKVIERPKVIYNKKTKQFVMWMHLDSEDYSYARSGVAVSDQPTGPFTFIRSVRPNDSMARDMTIFQDEDGKAYHFFSSENNATMHVCLLSDDYLSHTKSEKRILVNQSREAPAVFKYNGKYYLITSACTGWSPNAASYAVADSLLGEWVSFDNPCKGEQADLTFQSQSTYVFQVPDRHDAFIFMADRWNKTDLEDSRYIWLPLIMQNEKPEIVWQPAWDFSFFKKD